MSTAKWKVSNSLAANLSTRVQEAMTIDKTEAARRQLETAIDLYFDDADSLSVHTLAFASLKVLFDLYPHRNQDGFAAQLDGIIKKEGWKAMSGVANFLKHADRDPDALLAPHHPQQAMSIIGLATLLYHRITGDLSLKMRAFDYWVEELGYEDLEIEELDTDQERVQAFADHRAQIRALPHDKMMAVAKSQYRFFLTHFEKLQGIVRQAEIDGLSPTELLDQQIGAVRK